MLPTFSQNLTLQETFETVTEINEELKRMEFNGAFCKKFKLLVDRFYFLPKCRKSVEKMIHQKKNRGHQVSKIVKSRQSYSKGHLPYHCSFDYLARALMHDMACEFACTLRMSRNN